MPYIDQEKREEYDRVVRDLLLSLANASRRGADGEINYVITKILKSCYPPTSYHNLNRAIGVLECVKQEFYRRMVAPYEDKKLEEHGDIFKSGRVK